MRSFIPSLFWSVVSGIGLLGWIVAIMGMIWWGFRSDGYLSGKQSFIWGAIFVILYIIWIIGVQLL
jgi:hypothetical protein